MTPRDHMYDVASIGCVICREFNGVYSQASIHHIAEGSGKRSDFMVAGLCYEHHQGSGGLHGMGPKAFLSLYKLPTEYHLLGLVNKWRGR